MSGSSSIPEAIRARGLRAAALIALLSIAVALGAVAPAAAQQPVRGEAAISIANGYGRLVIRFAATVESQVRMSGGVLVIQFKQPVDVPVDRIAVGATEYIGAARRDPDGRAIRFALARKVKISTMTAGERLFVDLLPENWTAEPPGLPREVVEELARRAQDAERLARRNLELERQRNVPPVRVRVASQPTFTRYIFELPDLTGVAADRGAEKLTLTFAKPMRFDLADAKLASPASVAAVDATAERETAQVQFSFSRQVDVRTFREDFNFVVDVTPIDGTPAVAARAPLADIEAPPTVPALPSPAQSRDDPPPAAEAHRKPADKPAPSAPRRAASPAREPGQPVAAEMRRQGDNLRLFFGFAAPTPAAVFQRADALWLVFDTPAAIDVTMLANEPSRTVRNADVRREGGAQIVRLRLQRPRLVSVATEDNGWAVTIGEAMHGTTLALGIVRNIVGPGRTTVAIPFEQAERAHWLTDPDAGDRLLAITALGPARGLLKTQDFVEFRALASAHGIAVQPLSDDLTVELSADKVLLGRPGGLTLSDAAKPDPRARTPRAVTFDTRLWSADRDADFIDRQYELVRAAAEAPFISRAAYRLDLARFYFSREMYAEAKAVLDTALADEGPGAEDAGALVLRAVANIMLGRVDAGLKDLSHPRVGNQNDAPLWRAMIHARQGNWPEARDAFGQLEGALASLPLELQRRALKDALRASIEVGDYAGAVGRLHDFETIGIPPELAPSISVLTGRLAEGLGRKDDAIAAYRATARSDDRPAQAQARLREVALRYSHGDIDRAEAVASLESLTTGWRGDETEIEALQILARLYTEERRYRDAFHVMRVALAAHSESAVTRKIQDEAAKTFDSLFLAGKGDALPAIEALSLFYDFRELTPIGRRGDEMIRRLADRLVAVDLLDQAAELLQHQVDNRLQGAARAQVATRLAVIYLLSRKPDRAQAVLRATRTADLAGEVRIPRLLIEARALSDLGRHDFALEVIEGISGRESLRLRADIHWAARRWQKAAEHIELLHGDRWKSFEPLSDLARSDILRAAIAYALADDKLGMARLRDKYAAKMAAGPDRRAFETVTGGIGVNSAEFRAVARAAVSVDPLAGFLRDLRARYPDMHTLLPASPAAPQPGGPSDASKADTSKPDAEPTGTIPQGARLSAR